MNFPRRNQQYPSSIPLSLSLSLLNYPSNKCSSSTSTLSFVDRSRRNACKSALLPKRGTIFRIHRRRFNSTRFYLGLSMHIREGKRRRRKREEKREGKKKGGKKTRVYPTNGIIGDAGWRHDASCDGGRSTPDKPRQLFRVIARRESYGPLAGFINRGND